MSPAADEVNETVNKAQGLLQRYLPPKDRAWLVRMSVWHSFAEQQANETKAMLNERVRLSIIRRESGDRYSMHTLVRKAAKGILTPEEQREAEEGLIRGMAKVGRAMEQQSDVASKRDLAHSEVANVLRLEQCQQVAMEMNVLEGLIALHRQLQALGYFRGSAVACNKVRRNKHREAFIH
jgi:hypothetical protein